LRAFGSARNSSASITTGSISLRSRYRSGVSAYVESFNGRFRDECLNEHWFLSMQHARSAIKPGASSTAPSDRTARLMI
jgi:hypothetical protein